MNQARWSSSPPPDPAHHGVVGHLHAGEADGGVAVRIGVRERGVVHELDSLRGAVDEEQRGLLLAVHERLRHDDVHGGHVPVGHEPLLAVDHPAVAGAPRGGLDARGVRAGVGLGHGVRVVELAPQGRAQVAVDLLRRAAGQDVVGAGHVPGERVGGTAELLLHQEPLGLRPALPAVLLGVEPAGEPCLDRLALDARVQLLRDVAAGALGQLLVRDQHLVHEAPGAVPELLLLGGEVRGGGGDGAAGLMVMQVPFFPASRA